MDYTLDRAKEYDDIKLAYMILTSYLSTTEKNGESLSLKYKNHLLETTERRLANNIVKVAKCGGDIVASYCLHLPDSETSHAFINGACYFSTFVIHPNYQGFGIGEELLHDALYEAGYFSEHLCIYVNKNLHRLIKYYESFNFEASCKAEKTFMDTEVVGMVAAV